MVNFTSTIFAEGELIYTDGGLLAQYAWLLVLLPFVAALIITFMGKYLPLKGAEVALATIGLIFLYSSAPYVLTHYWWCSERIFYKRWKYRCIRY